MSEPLRSKEGSQSGEEIRRKMGAYKIGKEPSREEVSAWWKEKFGNDERAEGLALTQPWYSWRLWDRQRKYLDRMMPDELAEENAMIAEENAYLNSRIKHLLGKHTNRYQQKERSRKIPDLNACEGPYGSESSEGPSGSKGSEGPSGSKTSEGPCTRGIGKSEPANKRARSPAERPTGDLTEALSIGSQKKESMRRIMVPRGTYTPGEIRKLKKSGIEVAWEDECESEDESAELRGRIRAWRRDVHRILEEKKSKTWRSESTSEQASEGGSETTHVSETDEESEEVEVEHRGTYMYTAGALELLQGGLSLANQRDLAEAVLSADSEAYQDVIYEVNTKYKPVGKKVLPVPIALPTTDNPPLRRPPLSRDPYQTPLTPDMPLFEPGGKLTEERLALMDFGPEGWLSGDEKNLMLNVLRLREKALAFDGTERGKLKESYGDPYKIPVVPHTPWRQTALPIPLAAREKIIETFKARMEEGLYERSTSAYSGRWFVVAKKDGKYRIVHDLQPLNAVTIRDAGFPPVIEEFIEDFTGRACLGLMDVYGGYDQRELAEESRDLTTFQTPLGPVRLTRLPQGATNSVAEYQRVMVHVLAEEIPEFAGVFVDDVGVKGPTTTYGDEKLKENPEIRRFIWEYAVALERVLFRFEEAGLTVSGPKAAVVVPALNIVGTVCSLEGRRMSKSSKNKVSEFPIPRDVTEVRGFLGICTYVRTWIEKFADVARPLRHLTRNGVEFLWTDECQKSFEKLKEIVGRDLLLAKLQYGPTAGKIILAVDSSHIAAGGVIFQEDAKGKRQPARYESLTFTETESRYSQPKLELAGVAKMLKKLQMFLWGQHFTLEIDASALVQMINAPELPNAPMNRWLRFIQLFDFEIVHVPGKKHTLADGLSRARRDENDDPARDLDSLISAHLQLVREQEIVHEWHVAFTEKDYELDEKILAIGKYLSSLERPEGLNHTQWIKFQKRAGNFALSGGKLYRRRGGMLREVVLDPRRQDKFLKGVHDETGHRGREETSRRISDRVWWPGWSESVKNYVRTCEACQRRKPKQERERRNPTMSEGFFRKFNMDVTHIKEGKMLYLLTAREDLTGWVEGKALRKITSKAVSEFLSNTLIPRFGWFYQATLDGGAEFKGEMIDALKSFGIRRIVIAPYHPEANGMEERGHQPLVDCLVKICDSPKLWAKHLPMVLFADRISVRRTTGMTPFAMMYGTEAVLPIDHDEETWMISEWRDKQYSRSDLLKARFAQLERKSDRLIESTERLKAARLASVLYHDKVNAHRLRDALKPGALVLVHNAKLDNLKGAKFLARWTGPYRVVEKLRKGSYLLQELDGTPMRKVYAASRIRRYYPRGKHESEVKRDELTDAEDLPDEEDGEEGVSIEDLEQGEEIVSRVLGYAEDEAYQESEGEVIEDRKPHYALPREEEESAQEESQAEEETPTVSEESSEEERPVRERRAPGWMASEEWNLGKKKLKGKERAFSQPRSEASEESEEPDSQVEQAAPAEVKRGFGTFRKGASNARSGAGKGFIVGPFTPVRGGPATARRMVSTEASDKSDTEREMEVDEPVRRKLVKIRKGVSARQSDDSGPSEPKDSRSREMGEWRGDSRESTWTVMET